MNISQIDAIAPRAGEYWPRAADDRLSVGELPSFWGAIAKVAPHQARAPEMWRGLIDMVDQHIAARVAVLESRNAAQAAELSGLRRRQAEQAVMRYADVAAGPVHAETQPNVPGPDRDLLVAEMEQCEKLAQAIGDMTPSRAMGIQAIYLSARLAALRTMVCGVANRPEDQLARLGEKIEAKHEAVFSYQNRAHRVLLRCLGFLGVSDPFITARCLVRASVVAARACGAEAHSILEAAQAALTLPVVEVPLALGETMLALAAVSNVQRATLSDVAEDSLSSLDVSGMPIFVDCADTIHPPF
jgi:hypothetical protein